LRMRCISRLSLGIYQAIQQYGEEASLPRERNNVLMISATHSLKHCLGIFRYFDSFCRTPPHQPGTDRISRSMIELRSYYVDFPPVAVGEISMYDVVDNAEACLLNALWNVREGAGWYKHLVALIDSNT